MVQLRTFIVEDSAVIRQNLIAALEELTLVHVVGTADDEDDAVHWLSDPENRCDLVIVDIFLKRGSELGVLERARNLPGLPRLVVLSNYATRAMRERCLELGASKVFDKSNQIDELIRYCGGEA